MLLRVGSVAALLVLVTSCGGDPAPTIAAGPVESTPVPSTPLPSTSVPSPSPAFRDLAERCGGYLAEGDDPIAPEVLEGADGLVLRAGVFGGPAEGGVAMVLLHQTDGGGLCGWAPFATAAARSGVPSVALDLCGYGETVCAPTAMGDVVTQVRLAARLARERLGTRRIVLVGASMGGSQTVRAVAQGFRADGWVDVSGPGEWLGDTLLDLAPRVGPAGLVVQARSDGMASYADAQELATRTGSRFLDGGSGHGYELLSGADGLTPVGRSVLAYVRGR